MTGPVHVAGGSEAVTAPPLEGVLRWRRWPDARAEAAASGRPLFVLAEWGWTTSAQRLAWFIERHDDLRTAIEARWVPCHVDPWQHPDVVAWLRYEAAALTGEPGPPLLALLDDEAEPFVAFGTLAYEGGNGVPSLASLLHSAEELHRTERSRLRAEAAARRARLLSDDPRPSAPSSPAALAQHVVERSDAVHGGVLGATKDPLPHALLALLDAVERSGEGPAGPVSAQLELVLTHLARGGIRDQLWYGFHRASRDDRWVVPHFEKLVPANAALATAFARAGRRFERGDWIAIAEATLRWVSMALEAAIDAVEADTHYYTWTPQEVRRVVTPDVLQVLGFHYHITPHPARQVLHQAVPADDLHRHAHEPQETLLARLDLGREQLRQARHARMTPTIMAAPSLAWRADALVWALHCAAALDQDAARLLAVVDALPPAPTAPRQDAAEPLPGDVRRSFEEQASLAHLFALAGERAGRDDWRQRARSLCDDLLERWPRVEDRFALTLPAESDTPSSGVAVLDHAIASPVSHLLAAVAIIAPGKAEMRRELIADHAAFAALDPARSAAFWREALEAS